MEIFKENIQSSNTMDYYLIQPLHWTPPAIQQQPASEWKIRSIMNIRESIKLKALNLFYLDNRK